MSPAQTASTAVLPQWPPRELASSTRVFPERFDEQDTALDRWAAGVWLTLPHARWIRARQGLRLLQRVEAAAAPIAALDDDQLRRRARPAACAAFLGRGGGAAREGAQALACVREAARRSLGLWAHPPQVQAAWLLVRGRLVELDTGEGKTLTAGLAACIAALAGMPVHVVTVNDYLAQRDARTLAPLYAYFGLRVGVVHSGVPQSERSAEYTRDLTYCTNKDLVFDYLRDSVTARGVHSRAQLAVRDLHGERRAALRLRGLHFAIVDEADSILIDEARTPLILSSAREGSSDEAAYRGLLDAAAGLVETRDYVLREPRHVPDLLAAGRQRLQEIAQAGHGSGAQADAGDPVGMAPDKVWHVAWVREHYIVQALRALHLLRRDQHYVVADGKIVIVDEFTGRLLPDRSWELGLHQLVEVKEGCAVTGQNRTLARLTYQGFFGRYLRLSGMSGTLREVSRETASVYRVSTLRIEPNKPCLRIEHPSLLLVDQAAKHRAVVAEVSQALMRGQPVLVGTRSVRGSMELSAALAQGDIAHQVLNALQNADEAELIGRAGMPRAVTVATNMAGRGTDIHLDPGVIALGGLHVVLTEWHESARIDRQLFGRCARQGDPGSCRAIVALDDELLQRHAGAMAGWFAAHFGAAAAPQWVIRLLRRLAQRSAERHNRAQRRATLQQDRQMRTQLAFSGSGE